MRLCELATINSFPDLCELEATVSLDTQDAADNLRLLIDLRIAPGEITLGDHDCEISFTKVTISVSREGLDIVPTTRFGEPLKTNEVTSSKSVTKTDTTSSSMFGKLAGGLKSGPVAEVEAEKKRTKTGEAVETRTDEYKHLRVKARPNGRWEVAEYDGGRLDGTYMEQMPLFEAVPANGANRSSVEVTLKLKQKDLKIDTDQESMKPNNFFDRFSENHRRLIDIFIAKSLTEAVYGSGSYTGQITLSQYDYQYED